MAEERSLEYTPTWVVAFICFIIVLLSLLAERGLHHLGKVRIYITVYICEFKLYSLLVITLPLSLFQYLKRKKQDALFEALQKLKEGFIFLSVIQT